MDREERKQAAAAQPSHGMIEINSADAGFLEFFSVKAGMVSFNRVTSEEERGQGSEFFNSSSVVIQSNAMD